MLEVVLAVAFYFFCVGIIKRIVLSRYPGYALYVREIKYMRNPTESNHKKMEAAYLRFCEDYWKP